MNTSPRSSRRARRWPSLVVLALLGTLVPPASATSSGNEMEGKAALLRPDTVSADFTLAKGKVEIESKTSGDRHKFKVEVEKINPSLGTYQLFMDQADPGDPVSLVWVADLKPSNSNEVKYKAEIKNGSGSLPLGKSANSDLIGRAIEIRLDGGTPAFLTGTVPAFGSKKGEKGKAGLAPPVNAANQSAKGKIKVKSKPGDQRFEVEVKKLDLVNSYHVAMVDPADTNPNPTAVDLSNGALVAKSKSSSKGKYRRRTKDGDALPASANTVADLEGYLIEIRDDAGVVVLEGQVPALNGKKKAKAKLSPPVGAANPKAKGKLEIKSKSKEGKDDERFEIKIKKLDFNGTIYTVYMSPDAQTAFSDEGAVDWKGKSSELRYRRRTKKGESLPFGVTQVSALSGLAVEIHEDGTHATVLAGTVPVIGP